MQSLLLYFFFNLRFFSMQVLFLASYLVRSSLTAYLSLLDSLVVFLTFFVIQISSQKLCVQLAFFIFWEVNICVKQLYLYFPDRWAVILALFDLLRIRTSLPYVLKPILSLFYRLNMLNNRRCNMLSKIKCYNLITRLLVSFLIFFRPHEYFYFSIIVINAANLFSQFFRCISSGSIFFYYS